RNLKYAFYPNPYLSKILRKMRRSFANIAQKVIYAGKCARSCADLAIILVLAINHPTSDDLFAYALWIY
ncbi:hypothetical protein ACLEEB_16590, partial [Lonsdalea quercina]|uniref:hypothetical protein n=1 Tax=Lonsdalea quercina TaxID=71657 RepID=UPI0039761970